jgi:hypothetical protein
MKRRHAPSYRCQTCWISCKTREIARQHEGSGCRPTDRPTLMMNLAQEGQLEERMDSNMSDVEKWWCLFAIAHPDVSQAEVDRLQRENLLFPCMPEVAFVLRIVRLQLRQTIWTSQTKAHLFCLQSLLARHRSRTHPYPE